MLKTSFLLIIGFLKKIKVFFLDNRLEICLTLLLAFLPYRILNLLKINFNISLSIGILFFIFVSLFRKQVTSWFFNTFVFQAFIFLGFFLENFLYNNFVLSFIISVILGYNIPIDPLDYLFFCYFSFFTLGLYFRFKNVVLDFEHLNPELALEKAEDLNWEKVTLLFSFFLKKTYKEDFRPLLPLACNKISFPNLSRRSMFKRAFQHLGDHAHTRSIIGGVVVSGGAATGFGINTYYRHKETESNERIQRESIESNERIQHESIESNKQIKIQEIKSNEGLEEKKLWVDYCQKRDAIIVQTNPSVLTNPEKFNKAREAYDQGEPRITSA